MQEEYGDLWEIEADLRCITTNGTITAYEKNVMGGGCAAEAALRYPELPQEYAARIYEKGHHVTFFPQKKLVMFPVKYHVINDADLDLIETSCIELRMGLDKLTYLGISPKRVLLPRPGCGLGQLLWEDVKPIVVKHLGDDPRIIVVHFTPEEVGQVQDEGNIPWTDIKMNAGLA